MMDFSLNHLILQTIALLITAFLIPRFQVQGPISAAIMVIVLGVVNTKLWDAALFYQIPDTLTAQTLVTLLVNGVLFWGLAKCLPGVAIQGFLPAIVAPIVLTIVSILTYQFGRDINWVTVFEAIREQFNVLKGFANSKPGTGG